MFSPTECRKYAMICEEQKTGRQRRFKKDLAREWHEMAERMQQTKR